MKNTFLSLALIFGTSTLGFSQQAELKAATTNIESKNYIAALDNLNKAKKKVSSLMSEQLAAVLPAKFGELVLQKGESGYGMEGQGISLNKTYAKPQPIAKPSEGEAPAGGEGTHETHMNPMMMGAEQRISVQITTNMMMANEVMNAHSMAENTMGGGSKPIRVKGYRAIVRSNESEGGAEGRGIPGMGGSMEEAQAIVGAAFIRVEAMGLKEKGQAEKFLNAIDFDKLKGIVGE